MKEEEDLIDGGTGSAKQLTIERKVSANKYEKVVNKKKETIGATQCIRMPSMKNLNNHRSLLSSKNNSGSFVREDRTPLDASTLYNRKGSDNSYAEQSYLAKGKVHINFL